MVVMQLVLQSSITATPTVDGYQPLCRDSTPEVEHTSWTYNQWRCRAKSGRLQK